MLAVICTLFEGHYELGAAALLNSLDEAGFEGVFICGYRGALPKWADDKAYGGKISLRWVKLETEVHLTNYKPTFLKHCRDILEPGADLLYYFDPDIVLRAPWAVIQRWAQDGVALVEDVNYYLPSGHPYRLGWLDFFKRSNLSPVRIVERYYSGGFVGLPRPLSGFLDAWERIVGLAEIEAGSLGHLKSKSPHDLFHSTDQDAMNMALQTTEAPINGAGPEAMDFYAGGHLLSHAAGRSKPWRGGFFREALRGYPPGTAQKSFFDFVEKPIVVFSPVRRKLLLLELKVAAFIGRFYRRI